MQSEINKNNLLCIIAKLEVKLKNLSDDLNLEYKNMDINTISSYEMPLKVVAKFCY